MLAVAGGAALGLPGLPAGWLSGAILVVAAAALGQAPDVCPAAVSPASSSSLLGISLGGAVTPEPGRADRDLAGQSMVAARDRHELLDLCVRALSQPRAWLGLDVGAVRAAPGALSQALALAADTAADLRWSRSCSRCACSCSRWCCRSSSPASAWRARRRSRSPLPPLREGLGELALLVIVSTAAALIAYRVRLPGGLIFGAMLASALLHGTGVVKINLPPVDHHRLVRRPWRADRLALSRHRHGPAASALRCVVRRAARRDDGRHRIAGSSRR